MSFLFMPIVAVAGGVDAGAALRGILFFLADDMGQWAAEPYGNNEIITPTLSRLAKEGTTFTNAVCNTPVCSASRASLLTGRVPSQHGVHDWLSGGNGCSQRAINFTSREKFYTDLLAEHGFGALGLSGKYHLGNSPVARHGFNWWHFVHQSGGGSYTHPPMVANGSCVTLTGYITDMIADDAIRFVHAHARDATPWYLAVHFTSPHAPYVGSDGKASSMHPPKIVDLYANTPFHSVPHLPFDSQNYTDGAFRGCFENPGRSECLKGYFAAVTAMDAAIGRVLDAVDSSSVLDQTLVIFTSDHGFNTGHHGLWGKGNGAWPLNMVESSLKVPLFFRWPAGGISSGARVDQRVQHVDFAPTLLDLAGVDAALPKQAGSSYKSLVTNASLDHHQAAATVSPAHLAPSFHEFGGTRAVSALVDGIDYKLVTRADGRDELYNLTDDPQESDCLLARSATNSQAIAVSLRRMLMSWFDLRRDPFRSGWERPVTGKGQNDVSVFGVSVPVVPFQPLYP
jgi:arylsulfatase A-like enzyme